MLRASLVTIVMGAAVMSHAASLSPEVATRAPVIAALAADWAERYSAESLAQGRPLAMNEIELARRVGVREPGRIRIRVVSELPAPAEPMLVTAAARIGLTPQAASGMTLGHAVIVRRGSESDLRLLAHEFRHVAQYESRGGIRPFLAEHIPQLMQHGYENSPYEVDARAHEKAAS
ncbi:MAG TPA: DUF4157 domain-containing protein [Usitatibacter sp.]|nr:DUF4157 domain-containing protein [Usitatibacter sp.]